MSLFAKPSLPVLAMLLAAVVAAPGCTRPPAGPPLVPIAGRVTLDGSPVTPGIVSFFDAGLQGTPATLDADGRYRVQTTRGDGLPAGDYRVTVTPIEPAADPDKPSMAHEAALPRKPPRSAVPAKYQAVESSPLRVSIAADAADVQFDMPLTK